MNTYKSTRACVLTDKPLTRQTSTDSTEYFLYIRAKNRQTSARDELFANYSQTVHHKLFTYNIFQVRQRFGSHMYMRLYEICTIFLKTTHTRQTR